MKAREIKKSLIQERDEVIKKYDDAKRRSIPEMEAEAVKLSQLNHILLNYFSVNAKYANAEPLSGIERASKPEVDDVPF